VASPTVQPSLLNLATPMMTGEDLVNQGKLGETKTSWRRT